MFPYDHDMHRDQTDPETQIVRGEASNDSSASHFVDNVGILVMNTDIDHCADCLCVDLPFNDSSYVLAAMFSDMEAMPSDSPDIHSHYCLPSTDGDPELDSLAQVDNDITIGILDPTAFDQPSIKPYLPSQTLTTEGFGQCALFGDLHAGSFADAWQDDWIPIGANNIHCTSLDYDYDEHCFCDMVVFCGFVLLKYPEH